MVPLVLVRYGLTDWNRERRYQGQTDIPLNHEGIQQAEDLASRLADSVSTFTVLYSSDLQRAAQTARILGQRLGLTVQFDMRLREIALGDWEGRLIAEVSAGFGVQPGDSDHRAVGRILVQSGAPGGETLDELAVRVARCADEIAARHAGGRVLVVSHGMALAAISCLAHGASIQRVYDFTFENCRPAAVEWSPKG